ncbi:MAG: hypothetical protein HYR56_21575 [Acidobacteria bacterium]|nr:hypothetical protein [Acidobacteriota bacterium]MBI3425184.1 hypothetical protein [Acidobacteriota bacterium]
MKNRNVVRISVAILFTLFLAAPLLAQQSRQTGPARERVTREIDGRAITMEVPAMLPVTVANFEQYQNDLRTILLAEKEIGKLVNVGDKVSEMLDPMLEQLPGLKYSDLPPDYPGFPDLSILKAAVIEQQQVMARAFAQSATKAAQFSPTDPFPGAQYSLNLCPLNPQPPEVAYSVGFALLAAELVRELAQRACNQTILAFVFGGNFKIVCVISDAVYFALKVAYFPIKFCDDDTVGGNLKGANLRAEYVHNQLDYSIANDNANTAALSTQMTNAENHIVTNDNNNKAALSSQTATFQALTLRTAVERNLAADPTTVAAVGLFQLPASRGGYLESARQIVIDTYNAQLASAGAGVVVYDPSSDLALGASFTAQGKYREAYYYYRKAYRSIVKYP